MASAGTNCSGSNVSKEGKLTFLIFNTLTTTIYFTDSSLPYRTHSTTKSNKQPSRNSFCFRPSYPSSNTTFSIFTCNELILEGVSFLQNLIVLESRERNKRDVFLWIERNLQYPQKGDKIFILNSNSQNELPYIFCTQNTDTIIGMK